MSQVFGILFASAVLVVVIPVLISTMFTLGPFGMLGVLIAAYVLYLVCK